MASRTVRTLVCLASTAGALSMGLIATPVGAAAPCSDVEVVFARGSNEPPGPGHLGQAFVDALQSRLPDRSVRLYPVNYPASNDFGNSAPAGERDAAAHIEATAAQCPDTRIVLGGYSQGAGVIDMATNSMPPEIANHVAAGVLFGAPRSGFSDLLGGRPSPVTGPLYVDKTLDQCLQGDPICYEGGFDMGAHVSYLQSGDVERAADFAATRLG